MASQQLSKTLDRLDRYIQTSRGSLGSPRVVALMNELLSIQQFIQQNPKQISNINQITLLLQKVKDKLGMVEETDDS